MRSTDTPLLAWLLDGSRMSREVHVRFCERPVVQSRRPTHPRAILRARVGSRSAEASITVLDGDKMPDGTIKWSVPNYPGYKSKQIVQAVPTDRDPDIYTVEENALGKSVVRAWTSEGIFLWMRKFDHRIVDAVPH